MLDIDKIDRPGSAELRNASKDAKSRLQIRKLGDSDTSTSTREITTLYVERLHRNSRETPRPSLNVYTLRYLVLSVPLNDLSMSRNHSEEEKVDSEQIKSPMLMKLIRLDSFGATGAHRKRSKLYIWRRKECELP